MTATPTASFYSPDLSHVHHEGFRGFAESVAPELLKLLRQHGITGGLVVDLGCGSGVWPRELTRAGYQALGVDVSPAMLEIARTVAPAASFSLASAHTFEIPGCAAITAIGEGLGYIVEHEPSLGTLFARAHRRLGPGGLLVFDLLVAGEHAVPMRYSSTRKGRGWEVVTEVDEDVGQALLTRWIRTRRTVDGVTRESLEIHRIRVFPAEHVEAQLRGAGFAVESSTTYGRVPLAPRRRAFIAAKEPG